MKRIAKLPRTYTLVATRKDGKFGYVRYRSFNTDRGRVEYSLTLTKRVGEASRFIDIERLKERARDIKAKNRFVKVEIVDDVTKKRHSVID